MSETTVNTYKPHFEGVHSELLHLYKNAMTATDENEIRDWINRYQGFERAMQVLYNTGVLPNIFSSKFKDDIADVIKQVQDMVDINSLSRSQKSLTFSIQTLRMRFDD